MNKRQLLSTGKRRLVFLSLVLIALAVPLTVLLSRHTQNDRSRAAAPDQLETEGGVLGGPAQAKPDSLASGGQFVLFPGLTTPTPPNTTNSYYVSNSGNDSNSGTISSPWLTLQKAANAIPADSTVFIRAGTYAGFTFSRNLSVTSPVVFRSYPGENAVIDGKKTVAWVIQVNNGAHDVWLSNLTVQGGQGPVNTQQGGGIQIYGGASRIKVISSRVQYNAAIGIVSNGATNTLIDSNEVNNNGEGISIRNASDGVIVQNNDIYDQGNPQIMVDTPCDQAAGTGCNDDTGGGGIAFFKTTGSSVAKFNKIHNNRGHSYDYGHDGGGLETYGGANVQMTDNIIWDNENIFESGTDPASDPASSVGGCDNDIIARNIAYHTSAMGDPMKGVVLRCARNNIVTNNTFVFNGSSDPWAFDIGTTSTKYSGKIDGLIVKNNIVSMRSGKIVGISTNGLSPTTLASINLDNNLYYNPGFSIGSYTGLGTTNSFLTWKSWLFGKTGGAEANGINADPQFQDSTNFDYHLKSTSPAIGKGAAIPGITTGGNIGAR